MKKNRYGILIILFAGSIAFMAAIIALANIYQTQKNAFLRYYPPHFLVSFKSIDLGYNNFYIAGHFQDSICLGNTTAPGSVIYVNDSLSALRYHYLSLHDTTKLYPDYCRWQTNYPFMDLIDSRSAILLQAAGPGLLSGNSYQLPVQFTEEIVAISQKSYIVKHYQPSLQQSVLSKFGLDSFSYSPQPPLLERQIDGHFDLDGQLLYSAGSPLLVYMYYYRNQFICMDTNLHVLYKGKTIDSNSVAKIKLDTVFLANNQQQVTFSAPPLVVNKMGCLSGNNIYINSGLMADNDNSNIKNEKTIDIYDLMKKNYLYSFFLPAYRGYPVKQFHVWHGLLFAVAGRYLVSWRLNFT